MRVRVRRGEGEEGRGGEGGRDWHIKGPNTYAVAEKVAAVSTSWIGFSGTTTMVIAKGLKILFCFCLAHGVAVQSQSAPATARTEGGRASEAELAL